MRRFFAEDIDGLSKAVEISGDEFVHLKKVLRLAPGDEVAVFNGKGIELSGKIDSIGRHSALISIQGQSRVLKESPVEITLIQALLKGDRPEFIVQKATELGASEVIFYATPRTVPMVEPAQAGKKLDRWRKVSIEAAKQCGRAVLPEIILASDFSAAVKGADSKHKLLLWEKEDSGNLRDAVSKIGPGENAAALIGPEGGLSNDEAQYAEDAGFVKASLGPRILRAETAAVAVLSILQYAVGDLN